MVSKGGSGCGSVSTLLDRDKPIPFHTGRNGLIDRFRPSVYAGSGGLDCDLSTQARGVRASTFRTVVRRCLHDTKAVPATRDARSAMNQLVPLMHSRPQIRAVPATRPGIVPRP